MNSHVLPLMFAFALSVFPVIVGFVVHFVSAAIDSLHAVKPSATGAQTSASRA